MKAQSEARSREAASARAALERRVDDAKAAAQAAEGQLGELRQETARLVAQCRAQAQSIDGLVAQRADVDERAASARDAQAPMARELRAMEARLGALERRPQVSCAVERRAVAAP